jgi:hypothetical protein
MEQNEGKVERELKNEKNKKKKKKKKKKKEKWIQLKVKL